MPFAIRVGSSCLGTREICFGYVMSWGSPPWAHRAAKTIASFASVGGPLPAAAGH